MLSIFPDRFEETGEERGAYDLVLDSFWVGEYDSGRTVVHSIEETKVFIVRALDLSIPRLEAEGGRGRTRIRGSTSIQPASEHSRRIVSVNLFSGKGLATVLVEGKVRLRLLKPYATATSSIISHS